MEHAGGPLFMISPQLSTLGFGAYQIGKSPAPKYASTGSPMPTETEAESILQGVIDLGITLIDTAPAYGMSEARIGKSLSSRRDEFLLSTKVGELDDGTFDFSEPGMLTSIEHSLKTLQTDYVDYLLIHAPPDDNAVLTETSAVELLHDVKQRGLAKQIGFSGKSKEAQLSALQWADVMMIEYSVANQSNEDVISAAHQSGATVFIKKALNSGHLQAENAIKFLFQDSPVKHQFDSIVIGSKSLSRMKENDSLFRSLGS